MKTKQLPDKLSALILFALRDLAKAERSRRYRVDMGDWHTGTGGPQRCAVCLAGSVMAFSLNAPVKDYLTPESFSGPDQCKLEALNRARSGYPAGALYDMGVTHARSVPMLFHVSPYENNPAQFKKDMRRMARMLKEKGL